MKILLTLNETYRDQPDSSQWYVLQPLRQLGHDVRLYDTVAGDPSGKSYGDIIEEMKPDLIFCMMTGDSHIAPREPWHEIIGETQSGRTRTFNWFCDDTWRFENFSSKVCKLFTVCSTPERSYIPKYQDIGYKNIIVGNWHANGDLFPDINFSNKEVDVSFIGAPNPSRDKFFDDAAVDVEYYFGISQEELFHTFSNSKMSINLSVNNNDPEKKTQMKQRIFEIPAGAGLLITEYHEGLEEYFEPDREMITFSGPREFRQKMAFLRSKPKLVEKIASAGHQRFLKEHDSKKRLERVLEEIMKK